MQKAVSVLPERYEAKLSIDLQQNKKLMILLNLLSLLVAAAMVVPVYFILPVTTLFDMRQGLTAYFVRFGVMLVGLLGYIVLHEAVHGVAMKLCGTQKVTYGFTGVYAFAGSSDYYSKRAYFFIALAPVVLWGVIFTALCLAVPTQWFWVVYTIQMINISGAVGDAYVVLKFCRLPKDILVQDSGTAMSVYWKTT